ncbi:MAG: FAD-dependent oxidoreductase [Flavobacteriales bacterium]|nr:FAD-dependent oxidoreductase [Flavobacteriales bacterium]
MAKQPLIFAVDDDPQVLRAVTRDLKKKYRKEYRVISTISANEALETLVEFKKKGDEVALFLSDQRMPEMQGVDYLEKAAEIYPGARRILLTAYSDTDAAIKAINEVQLDYYLMKPWDPPEEKFYPIITDQLEEWKATNGAAVEGIRLLGYQYSPKSHHVKDFLSGNLFPYKWLDVESDPSAHEAMMLHKINPKSLPAVIFDDGEVITGDDLAPIAKKLGLQPTAKEELYEVAIIGAGPAGLAAGVYGGSEGLKTALIEKRAPGGQAGTSSRIENYLGFPKGLSGADLSRRAISQATRFGIDFLVPQSVDEINFESNYKNLSMIDGSKLNTKAVIVTTGVSYRMLQAEGLDKFTGAGVYYGAATTEATACKNQDVYVVGGGNSAGQGAVYLSNFARHVHILLRRDNLRDTMSSYLIDQIDGIDNITVQPFREVQKAEGEGRLTQLTILNNQDNETRCVDAGALFIFIGAKPYTEWLPDTILKDRRGFLLTGRDLMNHPEFKSSWPFKREPYALETSVPGVFAAGDVRSGAMNRVASAVGEGAMAVSFTHKYLAEI